MGDEESDALCAALAVGHLLVLQLQQPNIVAELSLIAGLSLRFRELNVGMPPGCGQPVGIGGQPNASLTNSGRGATPHLPSIVPNAT
jgi:hypothetical protein